MVEGQEDKYKARFILRGGDLGSLLGRVAVMQSGEQIGFTGKVFVKDDSEVVDIYEGDLTLRQCDPTELDYSNYRLSSQGHFSIVLRGVGKFVLTDMVHPAMPGRQNYGPFLYAERQKKPGCVVIESVTGPADEES